MPAPTREVVRVQEAIFAHAHAHAEESEDPDHEVGDLQEALRIAVDLMPAPMLAKYEKQIVDADLAKPKEH
jgi:hypothetical protein